MENKPTMRGRERVEFVINMLFYIGLILTMVSLILDSTFPGLYLVLGGAGAALIAPSIFGAIVDLFMIVTGDEQ